MKRVALIWSIVPSRTGSSSPTIKIVDFFCTLASYLTVQGATAGSSSTCANPKCRGMVKPVKFAKLRQTFPKRSLAAGQPAENSDLRVPRDEHPMTVARCSHMSCTKFFGRLS